MIYDVASATSVGRRDYQEDALAVDFSLGTPFGFAVVSDGMGGHAAGDVASKIVVTEIFSELKFQLAEGDDGLEPRLPEVLRAAALGANACVQAQVSESPELRGMGATLVAPVIFGDRLHWISIGDSPLFLYRAGSLAQLNEDHSLAPQIDLMVKMGQIDAEAAKTHPDRNSLTSVIMGSRIAMMDCPEEPETLRAGDIVVAASDGLQFLSDEEIAAVLAEVGDSPGRVVAQALLDAVEALDDPDQDNVSLVVIRVL